MLAAIHAFAWSQQARREWPGRKGVHARLRRAMPGHDGLWYCGRHHDTSSSWGASHSDASRRMRPVCVPGAMQRVKARSRASSPRYGFAEPGRRKCERWNGPW